MRFTPAPLQDAWLIDLEPHKDSRGHFASAYCEREFAERGFRFDDLLFRISSPRAAEVISLKDASWPDFDPAAGYPSAEGDA